MSKRHLTLQQKRRISERQSRPSRQSDSLNAHGVEQHGLVVAYLGKFLVVEDATQQVWRCHVRQNLGAVVVGDSVSFCPVEADIGVVTARQARHSELIRPDFYKQEKVIAANINQMVIVLAAPPIWHFLDKYLVAAELQGFEALIVLNKMDLNPDLEAVRANLAIYTQLGYLCLEVSCVTASGLAQLSQALVGKTSIFVGQSGVGKSSLINALFARDLAKVGEISEANQKGQHTTSTASLYHFPLGGSLIDSPGIREFGLWHISEQQALRGYKELYAYSGQCKFRDCRHQHTPGCAIAEAVSAGKIHPSRLASYMRVVAGLAQN